MSCAYCFFLKKHRLYPGSRFRMSDEVLESYISQLIESHRTHPVTVAWQGGEPTLMGVDFYRKTVALQEKYAKPGMAFENTIQTNATLLNDEWCQFLREHNFLVGVSIDGPRKLHDRHRMDKKGNPTFDRVMRGTRLLQKHGVEYNILVTVNRANASHPLEVYRFLRDEVGAPWMQFIPAIERVIHGKVSLRQEGSAVSDRTVAPAQWGRFLTTIFDEWVRHDVGKVFVQTFEAAVRNWAGLGSSGMCVFDPVCGHGPAMEHNGDLYLCDHFVEPDYLLGNIRERHMIELVGSDPQQKFGRDKLDKLPGACRRCDVRFACHGECPRNRFLTTEDGEPGLNYLCDGYKAFFRHIDKPLRMIVHLIKNGYPAERVMQTVAREDVRQAVATGKVGRNAPCPCGSGRKFKKCHGRDRTAGQMESAR